jgi:hypothetical protein
MLAAGEGGVKDQEESSFNFQPWTGYSAPARGLDAFIHDKVTR